MREIIILFQCLACGRCLAYACWRDKFMGKSMWMNSYLAKLGIHIESNTCCLVYFWGVDCPPSPSLPPCLQSLTLDMFPSVSVQGADWPTWHSGKEKSRKTLTFYLVTTPAQPIFSYPQLSPFIHFCLWIMFKMKLQPWLDISSAWESWDQIIIILTSGLFSCAVCYSKHLTRMIPFSSHNGL